MSRDISGFMCECVCVYLAIPHSLHKFCEWWCVVNRRKSVHYRVVLHFSLSVDDSIWCTFVLLSRAARFRNAKILNSIPTGGFPTSVFNGINIFISPMPHSHTERKTLKYIVLESIHHTHILPQSHVLIETIRILSQ